LRRTVHPPTRALPVLIQSSSPCAPTRAMLFALAPSRAHRSVSRSALAPLSLCTSRRSPYATARSRPLPTCSTSTALVVPSSASAVADIRAGADREKFKSGGYSTLPGWSYRSQWWISHDDHGAWAARGVHGQGIYIDPKAGMVIARFASHPLAGNAALDPMTLPAYRALAEYLISKPRP
jgi:hypothetical protein